VLPAGRETCPACSPPLRVEGALAPDPLRDLAKVEPIREIPGRRRREPTWKDEVRERVRRRRKFRAERSQTELPFAEDDVETPFEDAPTEVSRDWADIARGPLPDRRPSEVAMAAADESAGRDRELLGGRREEEPLSDLPLRADTPQEVPPSRDDVSADAAFEADGSFESEWSLDPAAPAVEPRPVERPARPLERLQAALVDFAVLAALAALVVYFAGRVARVPLAGLWPAWPYLTAYLLMLALVYAGYFSGTTGQTVGKILLDLRVVDTTGRAPGYPRALLRAALGAAGTLMLGLGLIPLFLDPARRAFHDRLVRTRVVRAAPPYAT